MELTQSQRASVNDGMWHAGMFGAGETYLVACAIALGASPIQTGILCSLPQLLSSVSQVYSLHLMKKMTNRVNFCGLLAVIQAGVWIPLAIIPLLGNWIISRVNLIILFTIGYFLLAGLVNPIWNSLFGDSVEPESRATFFGYRNKRIGIVTLGTILLAGFLLEYLSSQALEVYGFILLFAFAAFCRFISSIWLFRMQEPGYSYYVESEFSFKQFIERASESNFVKFVLFVAIFNLAVSISSPFLAVYFLRDVGVSYLEFMALTAGVLGAQFLTMQHWGKLADQFGTKKLLNIASIGVALVPFLFLISSSIWFLFAVQVYSGFMWAGYVLTTSTFIFDAVSPPKRARCIAYQSAINGVSVFFGTMFGGLLTVLLPMEHGLHSPFLNNSSNLLIVFLIAGMLRMIVLVFLTSFKEVRTSVGGIGSRDLLFRISAIRPLNGAVLSFTSARKKIVVDSKHKLGGGGTKLTNGDDPHNKS